MNTTDDIEPDKATGWRGSAALWLEAAKAALIEGGVEAVKIQPLAAHLELSRTSFYWFFKDRNALLDALLEDWETKNTGAFETACAAYADTVAEAMLNLITVFHDEALFEPRLDFAVRGWAHRSEAVTARINAADETRLAAIHALFTRFGFDAEDADVRARTVYLVQIGYIAMQVEEDRALRMARVPGYVRTYCGRDPTPSEMARFHARLAFQPGAGRAPR
ncbi:MAG: TetR/AcrR family transcriptional regulator [Marinovum algicola]|uniref:Transcriptional regulator, TetR family n=1 Tax=Marinovum algicola TaxID=42444 RepID=A0A975WCQ7_9RHOB|nr:TetR/AcrR family transcriptional regulator [Marinovum algicola]AKO99645.1 Transcriptional regulator [Marinovum algicola DG 898]SEJ93312.1 transcriptional regulator, TetR family [Marinovum algicola]SLN64219.1 Bacterial regulatory proteins, tetR family [Marinovum algicola]